MMHLTDFAKGLLTVVALAAMGITPALFGQAVPAGGPLPEPKGTSTNVVPSSGSSATQAKPAPGGAQAAIMVVETPTFATVADKALDAMKKRAGELNIKGVAVVAFAEGDKVSAWSSKMVVVGNMTTAGTDGKAGSNLLGIAYTKASEMADTLKDSGSKARGPLTGEYGWQGGVVSHGKTGILIAAFSGGPSEDDVKVSKAGLAVLGESL